ncbi:hypothetical protein SKAU_G00321320 [Synaphobranchus kaupii]|uniref:Profilin n=1 Tax=Synaphobranchus kaupii TaxID=118154 RepID=A0A9Q1ENU4_SYNKA|nr:hypothetical protein SKAU_G00321320 [Synaphobranchus kaupii]
MSWDAYIQNLMESGQLVDAAICGCTAGDEYVWASHPGGCLSSITPQEIQQLMSKDRKELMAKGVILGGMKCLLIRDGMDDELEPSMDLKSTGDNCLSITIAKSDKALVIVTGKTGTHSSTVHISANTVAGHLKNCDF